MIDHLATILEAYPGRANRTRCFTHILNLSAKCIMKQFDAPKKKKSYDEYDNPSDDEMGFLTAVLEELDDELEGDGGDGDGNENDGWEPDMRADMTEEEVEKLEECVRPVRRVLMKVSLLCNI
jgi:hypothetical protein